MPLDFRALAEGIVERAGEALVPSAHAWSGPVHEAQGDEAARQLTPEGRAYAGEVAGGNPAAAARAPDEERETDRTRAGWHYANVPADHWDPAAAELPDHSVAAYRWAVDRLRDPRATLAQRREALQWALHLAGDLTQPLHVSDAGDAGGNAVPVVLPHGRPTDLHTVWDRALPAYAAGGSGDRTAVARMLQLMDTPERRRAAVATMDPLEWAREAHALGASARQAPGGVSLDPTVPTWLTRAYADTNAAVAREQMYRSAARMAALVNQLAAERRGSGR